MPTTLKFEFLELVPPKGMKDPYDRVVQALRRVSKPVTVEGVPLRVETCHEAAQYIYGSASRVDLTNLPMVISPTTPGMKGLGIREDEGLGRPTSFLVTKRGGKILLVLHRNGNGLRIGGFLDLLQQLDGGESFEAVPIILTDKLQQVLKWSVYRRLEVRIANPSNREAYDSTTMKAAANLTADTDARAISIVMSMGRARKGTLSIQAIRSAVSEFVRPKSGTVEALVISGAESEDHRADTIDLLRYRLIQEIEVPGHLRTLEVDILEAAVQQANIKAENELKKHFGI
ncbi:MAG TPA: DUF6731 family protein [Symbiobacteriaceae bacterium]